MRSRRWFLTQVPHGGSSRRFLTKGPYEGSAPLCRTPRGEFLIGTRVPVKTRWTVAPTPASSWFEAPLYAHRVDASGPDVFMVETNTNTWERTLRAVTASGEVQWLMTVTGVPLMGDSFGGVVVGVEPTTNECLFGPIERCYKALTRFAGSAGTLSWRYDSPGLLDRPAQGPDGTLYAIEYLGSTNKSVVILDGATGQVTARVPLVNFVTDHTVINHAYPCYNSYRYETEPVTVGPIVGGDGFGYLVVSSRTQMSQGICGVSGFTYETDTSLTVLRLSRAGEEAAEVIAERHCTDACGAPWPTQLLPDGIGGLLVVAQHGHEYPDFRVTRLDGAGGRVDTLVASQTRIDLVGPAGRAFLRTPSGTHAVDVRVLTPIFSLPPELKLLAASSEGGLTAHDPAGALLRFTHLGLLTETTALGLKNPVPMFGGWVGNSDYGLSVVAGSFDDATYWDATYAEVFWTSPEQYGFGSPQKNLAPPQVCGLCFNGYVPPDGKGPLAPPMDPRRIVTIAIDDSWKTAGVANSKVVDAVTCAVDAWNDATDGNGTKTGFFSDC